MGQCYGKDVEEHTFVVQKAVTDTSQDQPLSTPLHYLNNTYSYAPSPLTSPLPVGASPSPARATPRRFFRRPFPPPSPAKHIYSSLVKRHGVRKRKEASVPEVAPVEGEKPLDKSFGYSKSFGAKYELRQEIGHGHFGHTCYAKVCKGELKGQSVAVKIISKKKMTTAIAIEDVRREVKILKALSGHHNLVLFHDVCEDDNNVYIIMELCEGGELLDRILSSGGRFSEEDAKGIVVQILSVVSFCHLQGVVHRDLKPENFLFTTKDENAPLKAIDFGLSDFIRPDERLNDIVGSAYYVAPEVLHQSYSMEADVWSIGVITYILLCGSRPFWAQAESGIFRAVLRAEPNFDDAPWPSISPEAKDFVKRLLNKDLRKRMSAAQAISHPWLCGKHVIPLDISVYKQVKAYLRYLPLKRAALKALVKSLREDDLVYLRAQFKLLQPDNNARISLENFKSVLMRHSTEAMKESKVPDILNSMNLLAFRKMNFEEFCAAATSVYQLEALDHWEEVARSAFAFFEQQGNRVISVEELAQELNLGPTVYAALHDWIRHTDGKLSFFGFTKFLHGVTLRSNMRTQRLHC